MTRWKVRDVMTTRVITAPDDAPFAQLAALMAAHRISAVAITDRFDTVVGVVSWTDLIDKVETGHPGTGWLDRWAPSSLRWGTGNAAQVMSAPAVTIGSDASLPAAARAMHGRGIGQLLVTDADRRLRGVVTSADLTKIHARPDSSIREELTQQMLRRTLMIEPSAVQTTVNDGVVTLTGRTKHKSTATTAVKLAAAVAGVTDVVDQLSFVVDDTAPAASSSEAPRRGDPFPDWWTARRLLRDVRAGMPPGGNLARADSATRPAALR